MDFIENECLSVSADTRIGELHSIKSKKTGKEYLWNGDPKWWAFHAPLVFPVCGSLSNNTFRANGKEYNMTKHGFIRDSVFEMVENTGNKLVYRLISSDETRKCYPYEFALTVTYVLNKNNIDTICHVENKGKDDMYFSIGGHPAFMCPFNEGEHFDDYYVEFPENENATRLKIIPPEGYFKRTGEVYLKNEKTIPLKHDMFTDDAIFLEGYTSDSVCLKSKKSDNFLKVTFKGFPVLGIWTKVGAPYVCIEPWHGMGDLEGFSGDVSEKAGIIRVKEDESFTCNYNVEVCE